MAKTLMVQGTMSSAGKSFIVAGLLRVMKEDGFKVAPFKSQNMALNSFITKEGLEMGRAQVMQAEAAGIEASVKMNPILLKPTTDMGSQIIVNGKAVGTMQASEYFKYKKNLIPQIMDSFNSLKSEYDIIVIEGAGSPAEINLKSEDIVNMGMAKMADAPVILVGDIDRGGIFAQLYGTIELLEEDEKRRIVGTIVNKFRGDKEILNPGIKMLEEKTGKTVLGVMPMIDVSLEDEDSVSSVFDSKAIKEIDIVIIRLPKISNFTDFIPLECIEGVSVRYVKSFRTLGNPDLIIIPGTKNTIKDLVWLKETGLESGLLKKAEEGTLIFGVCGGYQMLGKTIKDPLGVEGFGEIKGLGLLPQETVFEAEKTTTQVSGEVLQISGGFSCLSGCKFKGYEIHMGQTEVSEGGFSLCGNKKEGGVCHNVAGTYVHGFFESGQVTKCLIDGICQRKGITLETECFDYEKYKESQYKKLGQYIRDNIDMKKIYEIIGVKK